MKERQDQLSYKMSFTFLVYHIEAETKWPLFQRQHFKCIVLNENFGILNKISLINVPSGLIDNMVALVQIMAWCWTGNKPLLSESVLACCTDRYMCYSASMSSTNPRMFFANHVIGVTYSVDMIIIPLGSIITSWTYSHTETGELSWCQLNHGELSWCQLSHHR